jgi:hypothetical protein
MRIVSRSKQIRHPHNCLIAPDPAFGFSNRIVSLGPQTWHSIIAQRVSTFPPAVFGLALTGQAL